MKIIYLLLAASVVLIISVNRDDAKEILKSHYIRDNTIDSTHIEKRDKYKGIGIGPIKKISLGAIDDKLVMEGKNIFSDKCSACHSLDVEVNGPALGNITKILRPEYIMNYLLNTVEMQKKDLQLKKLIKKYYGEAMPDLELKEPQARALLEYFRSEAR
jgi:cytochrome c1